ncbi:hypothetical protein [Methylophaga pinxianii]|uniref:hypothetical protein n=1 Tax=Methylophaga pinxianii TaxID=2881052 RepID=UPI001CF60CCF|nr:hypothetical protein [Methylophaga pinxianii]UPH45734.1 hypothetical protein LGT42_000185 [Methylophaga pinxianii]
MKHKNLNYFPDVAAAAGRSFILHAQNKRTKQKGSPCSPCGFPVLLDLVGHDGNSLRSNSRHADPASSAMLGFA